MAYMNLDLQLIKYLNSSLERREKDFELLTAKFEDHFLTKAVHSF